MKPAPAREGKDICSNLSAEIEDALPDLLQAG
jgi:hypothetical protein